MKDDAQFIAYVGDNIRYDKESGLFWWTTSGRGRWVNKPIGHIDDKGRPRADIMGRKVRLSRLAWRITYGFWPSQFIDHIDGNPSNNRINNLRECSNAENQQNRGPDKGRQFPLGVSKYGSKFRAQITLSKNHINIGVFETVAEAEAAYLAAKAIHHRFCPVPYSLAAAPDPGKGGEA